MLHYLLFFTNVLRILDEQRMSKHQLSEVAGVSISFISDITSGQGNPSIKVMEKIAVALKTPLPFLMECSDLPPEALEELAGHEYQASVAPGYERVSVVLPAHRAFIVRRWAEETARQLEQ